MADGKAVHGNRRVYGMDLRACAPGGAAWWNVCRGFAGRGPDVALLMSEQLRPDARRK